MERIVAYLQELIDRNQQVLSMLLMERYGLDERPTPKLLLALYKLHGNEFLHALSTHLQSADLVHIEGYEDEPWLGGSTSTTTTKKKSLLDQLSGVFEFGTKLASQVKPAGGTNATPAPAANNTTKIIIIGGVVLVVLIVIAIIVRKKSN